MCITLVRDILKFKSNRKVNVFSIFKTNIYFNHFMFILYLCLLNVVQIIFIKFNNNKIKIIYIFYGTIISYRFNTVMMSPHTHYNMSASFLHLFFLMFIYVLLFCCECK